MLNLAKRSVKGLLNRYPQWLCRREYESQKFTRLNERPVEYSFVFRKIAELSPRTVLDVGTGITSLPHLIGKCGCVVTAIDNVRDYWPQGMINRHYHVIDDDITDTRLTSGFDLITCISVLEHIRRSDAAVKNLFSLLGPRGHLILTFPYNERVYADNVYELPGSSYGQGLPYFTQSYARPDVERWLRDNDAMAVEQEYWRYWEGEHWTVGRQVIPPQKVTADDAHQLTCLHVTKRGWQDERDQKAQESCSSAVSVLSTPHSGVRSSRRCGGPRIGRGSLAST